MNPLHHLASKQTRKLKHSEMSHENHFFPNVLFSLAFVNGGQLCGKRGGHQCQNPPLRIYF
jgi:hypothetical protein